MAIQFNLRASSVIASLPAGDNVILCPGGTTIFASGPAAVPISDAENRVRFVVTGSAPNGDFCGTLMTLVTRHRFLFQPTESGRLTASAFFTPSLFFALTCAGEGGLFELFDKAGPVSLNLLTRMSVRVRAQNGTIVLNSGGAQHNRFFRGLPGISVPSSSTGGFAPELMDIVETRSFATQVVTTDQVRVDARYILQVFANDISTFLVDAGAGAGLNVPMAVIRTDP